METEPTVNKMLQIIILELEPNMESDQVCESATAPVQVVTLVEYEGMEERPNHISATEGERQLASVDLLSLFDPLVSSSPSIYISPFFSVSFRP